MPSKPSLTVGLLIGGAVLCGLLWGRAGAGAELGGWGWVGVWGEGVVGEWLRVHEYVLYGYVGGRVPRVHVEMCGGWGCGGRVMPRR